MKETEQLIPIRFYTVRPSKAYTCVVLGTDEKKFAIYTDLGSGHAMQTVITDSETSRPFTHELLNRLFRALDVKIRQIVINDLEDSIYFARIFFEQMLGDKLHIIEIDARPSDCLTLGLSNKTPLYCTREVWDKVVPFEE